MQTSDENQCAGGGHGKGIKEDSAAEEDQRMPTGDGTTEESSINYHIRPKLEWSTEVFVLSTRAVSCRDTPGTDHGHKDHDQPLAHLGPLAPSRKDVVIKTETFFDSHTLTPRECHLSRIRHQRERRHWPSTGYRRRSRPTTRPQ